MMASGTGKARGESRVRIRQEHAQGDACAKVQPCRCPCGVSKCVETVSKSMSKSTSRSRKDLLLEGELDLRSERRGKFFYH